MFCVSFNRLSMHAFYQFGLVRSISRVAWSNQVALIAVCFSEYSCRGETELLHVTDTSVGGSAAVRFSSEFAQSGFLTDNLDNKQKQQLSLSLSLSLSLYIYIKREDFKISTEYVNYVLTDGHMPNTNCTCMVWAVVLIESIHNHVHDN